MVDFLALSKWSMELLERLYKVWSGSKGPLHQQAVRVLDAFKAHGVSPHQIPRLLPETLELTSADLASPAALASKMSTTLVDWTAETLALRREWLELEDNDPHQRVHWYKDAKRLYAWLKQQREASPNAYASLHVFSEAAPANPDSAHGRFLLVYEQVFAELGEKPLSRYWTLSDGMYFEHESCLTDLLSALTLAEHFGVAARGHSIKATALKAAEERDLKTLLPRLLVGSRPFRLDSWIPLRYQPQNCQSARHAALFHAALQQLPSDLNLLSTSLKRV